MNELLAALGLERITFQTFADRPSDTALSFVFHGPLAPHRERLTRLNKRGAGIYFMVNQGDQRGRRTENVKAITAYFCDLDGAELPATLPLPATAIVVTSPGRYHVYWRVHEAPLGTFAHVQRHIALLLSGDPKVCDLPRVMRLPGFYHVKREPFLCTVTHLSDCAYSHSDFCAAFAVPEPPKPLPPAAEQYLKRRGNAGNGDYGRALDRIAGAAEGSRNDTLYRLTCALVNTIRDHALDPDTVLEQAIAAGMASGLDEREARKAVLSAARHLN